jgi:hypothetical protein
MKINLSFFLFFIIFNSFSQQIKIWGKVVDSKSYTKIENVSISIKNGNQGTFSNEKGEFIFTFEETSNTILFQLIGYKPYEFILDSEYQDLLIYLEPDPFFLDEVIVYPDSSLILVKDAFSRIKENYPDKQHLLKGYYRESVIRDDRYVRFLDAAIGINDYSYKSDPNRRKVELYSMRKSQDFVEEGIMTKIYNRIFNDRNYFLITLQLNDIIRRYEREPSFFRGMEKDLLDFFNFKVDSVLGNDENRVIKIAFNAPTVMSTTEGFIFINLTDMAIVKFEMLRKLPLKMSEDPLWQQASRYYAMVEYKKINNRYYLSRFVSETPENFDALDFSTNSGTQFLKMELWINEVFDNKKFFEKIKNKDKLDLGSKLKDLDIMYDPVFWNSFNYIPDSIEYQKMVKDLEKIK